MKIIWTRHAVNRQTEWEKNLGVTREEIEVILQFPQQVVKGDLDAFVAQSKFRKGLIRIPFMQQDENRKILTVYYTTKIERYWKEIED